MRLASKLCAALVGVCAIAAAAGSASAETRFDRHHPRQASAVRHVEVIDRALHQRRAIKIARAKGEISRVEAHRLLARNARVIHRERVLARANGARLTRHEAPIHRHLG